MIQYHSTNITDPKAEKRNVTLIFYRDQLLYDAKNYAYIEGDVMGEGAEHSRHMLIDIAESGNIDRANRVMPLCINICRELLYPYTKSEIPETVENLNDVIEEPAVYNIELSLPMEFSRTTLELLESLIHEFIVYNILAEWMQLVKPDGASKWLAKAEAAKQRIKGSLNVRRAHLHRPMKPF